MEDTLKIYAYSDAERSTELGVFECYVSPLSIKMNRNNRFGRLNTINGTIPLTAFSNGGTNSLELTIVLDGTGAYAVKDDEPYKVVDQLNDLMKYTVLYDGSIHQPPFLKVVWGTIPVFVCRAQDLDVDYKTFNSEGVPVQADVKLKFIEDVDLELSKKIANKESPDLFHEHLVMDHETLPSISYRYYNDTGYIHRIAKENGLNNLYAVIPGDTLIIPPLHTKLT
jgi:hypothetical protein